MYVKGSFGRRDVSPWDKWKILFLPKRKEISSDRRDKV